MRQARARTRGFSLMELIVALGIIAIIAAISVPAYARYRSNLQLKSTVDQVAAALRQARSSATQLADGAVADQVAIRQLSSASDRYTVYSFKGGIPSAVQSGDAQYQAVSTSGQNLDSESVPVPPTGPVGAAVLVGRKTVFFGQDGRLPANTSEVLKFSNGDRTYWIVVQPEGTVRVTEGEKP